MIADELKKMKEGEEADIAKSVFKVMLKRYGTANETSYAWARGCPTIQHSHLAVTTYLLHYYPHLSPPLDKLNLAAAKAHYAKGAGFDIQKAVQEFHFFNLPSNTTFQSMNKSS